MLAVLSMSPPVAHFPAVQRRPKLSLQTSELPISYGTSSRGLLTIATPGAATTPTTFNTFNNTYDLTHRPSPTSATISPSILRSTSGRDPISRSQSPRPKRAEAAYSLNLPFGIKPILKNSPFPRLRTNSISASPRSTTRRVFFPAPKQVVFKNVLEEEIVTEVYVARHSDLFEQEVGSEDNGSEEAAKVETLISSERSEAGSSISITSSKRRKCRRNSLDLSNKRPNPVSEPTCTHAATPSSTRKRRRWEWTLGPLPSQTNPNLEVESNSSSDSTPELADTEPKLSVLESSESSTHQDFHKTVIAPRTRTSEPSTSPRSRSQPYSPSITHHARPSTLQIQVNTLSLPLSSPPSPNPPQRRAGSLDGSQSPRKRKAECLLDIMVTKGRMEKGDLTGESQTGPKRRVRAATL